MAGHSVPDSTPTHLEILSQSRHFRARRLLTDVPSNLQVCERAAPLASIKERAPTLHRALQVRTILRAQASLGHAQASQTDNHREDCHGHLCANLSTSWRHTSDF